MLALLTTFLPLIIQVVSAAPSIVAAWDAAPKNSLQAVATAVQTALPASLVNQLAEAGAQLFPGLSPELHAAAAALLVAHPNSTSWAQSTLNLLASTGYMGTPAPAPFPLKVDGIYGAHTAQAIKDCQAKMGLPVTGILADAEFTMLGQLLAKA